jgi:hypothetical protein
MNDPLDEIAVELERLQPCQPSQRLTSRLEQELGAAASPMPTVVARPWWFRWAPLAAAAALAVIVAATIMVKSRPGTPTASKKAPVTNAMAARQDRTTPQSPFRRVNNANYLLEAEDNGLVYTSATAPLRKVRWQYLSTSEWRDERGNTTVQFIIPREETVLIPVRIH